MNRDLINFAITIALFIFALAAHFLDEAFYITLATRVVILSMAGIGLNIALGYGGLISFGHAAFWGIGGYTTGVLLHHAQNYTLLFEWFNIPSTDSMLIIWLLAILLSGISALIIGVLSLRTSGVYFIMVTLAFAQMIYYFHISWPAYGGEDGLPLYGRSVFPWVESNHSLTFFLIAYVVLVIVVFFVDRLNRSPFGLVLNAVRQNAERVETVGINPMHIKLTAFVISGMITGLAGALFADLNRFVSPQMFSWHVSGEIMIFVILGGVARLVGPIIGASVFVCLEYVLGGFSDSWQFYLGLLLLLIVLFAKGGILGLFIIKKERHE